MNKALENNLRVISVPAAALIGVILVFILAGNFVWGKINSLLDDYGQAQKEQATLKDKLSSLQNNQSQISDFAQSLIAALPDGNSSLALISQLKSVAQTNNLTVQNIEGGAEISESGLSHVDISFDVQGANLPIFNLLDSSKTIAPLNKVTRFKLTTSGSGSLANITVRSYWAGLPTKIPAVSDPLQKITPEEQTTLQGLSSLRQPQFVELTPSQGGNRTNPFSL